MGALTRHRARDPWTWPTYSWMWATDRNEAVLRGSHDVTELEEDISDDRF